MPVLTHPYNFTLEERRLLLRLARQSVEAAACSNPAPAVDLDSLSERLRQPAACFVTLHIGEDLRGCTGVLVARSPLVLEVIHTAGQTALNDPRFWPVQPDEVPFLDIEISVLTPPVQLEVPKPSLLPSLLHPGVDGVTLVKGHFRATFLPQVWERIPNPPDFLDLLCQKMGLPRGSWRYSEMRVETYRVEEFSERELATPPASAPTPLE